VRFEIHTSQILGSILTAAYTMGLSFQILGREIMLKKLDTEAGMDFITSLGLSCTQGCVICEFLIFPESSQNMLNLYEIIFQRSLDPNIPISIHYNLLHESMPGNSSLDFDKNGEFSKLRV
jgi:hypothetical protein